MRSFLLEDIITAVTSTSVKFYQGNCTSSSVDFFFTLSAPADMSVNIVEGHVDEWRLFEVSGVMAPPLSWTWREM